MHTRKTIITELEKLKLRNYPAVMVHTSMSKIGEIEGGADFLLNPTQLHDYHGPGSVLERLTDLNGVILRLGADTDTVTLTHLAEYLADVPNKRRVSLRYERADSGEQWIDSLDDSEGIAEWNEGDYFPKILLDYLKTDSVSIGQVGSSVAELFPAKIFVAFAKKRIETNLGLESRMPS